MATKLSRRDFMKLTAGTAGAAYLATDLSPFITEAKAAGEKLPVILFEGQACTGCSVSMLNTISPDIQKVLTEVIDLHFHATVMASAGEMAWDYVEKIASDYKGKYVLVVEGAIPRGEEGKYCVLGENKGKELTMLDALINYGKNAAAVVALGTCATYGGFPAASPNPTDCAGAAEILNEKGINTPVINIAGCPPHPDWIIGTIAYVALGLGIPELDKLGRPKMFFTPIIHDNCPRRQYFDNAIFAEKFGDPGCLIEIGCKGPIAFCDATTRFWNGGVNTCIVCGGPCLACTSDEFPNFPIYARIPEMPVGPGITASINNVGLVLGGLTVAGIAGHLAGNVLEGRIGLPKLEEHDKKEGDE